jgi:hypothetical protein
MQRSEALLNRMGLVSEHRVDRDRPQRDGLRLVSASSPPAGGTTV